MEVEEMSDMAINLVRKKGAGIFGSRNAKLLKLLKASKNTKEDILSYLILLMFIAGELGLDLEDSLLNKIEITHRT